ncbi:MAG: hypothetical protein C4339_06130 [Nitrososphaerota archaeon]
MPGQLFSDASLRNARRVYVDRIDAGERLAAHVMLSGRRPELLLGLSPGGLHVALGLARALNLPFSHFLVLEIESYLARGPPLGYLTPTGRRFVKQELVASLGLDEGALARLTGHALARLQELGATKPRPELRGLSVLLVEEALANPEPLRLAAEEARLLGAKEVGIGAPTGHERTVEALRASFDYLICPLLSDEAPYSPEDSYIIWYEITFREGLKALRMA